MAANPGREGLRRCACQRVFEVKVHNQRFCSSTCKERVVGRRRRRNRGTSTERGYGYQHKKLRAEWDKEVQAGRAHCWRPDCRRWLPPGQPWQLGHLDDRSGYGGPECPTCNLKHAAIKGNKQRVNQYTSSAPRIAR